MTESKTTLSNEKVIFRIGISLIWFGKIFNLNLINIVAKDKP